MVSNRMPIRIGGIELADHSANSKILSDVQVTGSNASRGRIC